MKPGRTRLAEMCRIALLRRPGNIMMSLGGFAADAAASKERFMTVLMVLLIAAVVLAAGGTFYSRLLARMIGEDPHRPTPAVLINDGRDYVPSPTPVVFAHHFAAIAGAGPILGPAIAIVYGWVPALLWVVLGGVLIGAVHDYLATYMATREGGQSVATITQRVLGKGAFVGLTLFIIVMLALVCATFLNASATALVSMLPLERVGLGAGQKLFRIVHAAGGDRVVIGGIASMSVIIITVFAPLLGWMYIKKKVAVWKCSVAAVVICAVSIAVGVYYPVSLPTLSVGPLTIKPDDLWKFLLSAYVLVAAGLPVWLFLQSRDYINAHILYIGMGLLLITLIVAGLNGPPASDPLPAFNLAGGAKALGPVWPMLFITIACGAVSGFHSLCGGGTTCKQITSERSARRIGYYAMLLESFVAVCVIVTLMVGTSKTFYFLDVHPRTMAGAEADPNAVLGFAVAVGNAANIAFGLPVAFGALAGMVLLEGFLITTLDAAIRLTRYLLEEVWRVLLARYDVFAPPVDAAAQGELKTENIPAGADGIPIAPLPEENLPAPASPVATRGLFGALLRALRHYWVNSGLAVLMMLALAFTADLNALWRVFATANQLLAAMVLSLATLWLLRQRRRVWFVFVPGMLMLVTTCASLLLLLYKFVTSISTAVGKGLPIPPESVTLLVVDAVIIVIISYLLIVGIRAARSFLRELRAAKLI